MVRPITVRRLRFGPVWYVPLAAPRAITAGPGPASLNRASGEGRRSPCRALSDLVRKVRDTWIGIQDVNVRLRGWKLSHQYCVHAPGVSGLFAVEGVAPRMCSCWTVGCESSGGASVVVLAVCEDLGHVCLRPVSEPARHVVEREAEVGQLVGDGDRDGWRHGTGEQTIVLQRP